MRISVFGLGYVGTVVAACLARDGHDVLGVDVDPVKLSLLRRGEAPILEEGIEDLVAAQVRAGRLRVGDDPGAAVRDTELSFLCVGTPSGSDGGLNLDAVLRLGRELGGALRGVSGARIFVLRSTVLPGTTEEVFRPLVAEASGKRPGIDFHVCYQPEFLREGSSIRDYDQPPFTILGGDAPNAIDTVRALFAGLPCETIVTDIRTAELVKYACNAFHAMKVTFANEIGRIGRACGVDAREVMRLVCEDRKLNLSPAYLTPGFAFGGSCLPKDLRALVSRSREAGLSVPMLESILPSNHVHVEAAIDLVLRQGKRRVGLIGLSFKGGTDDLRESPLLTLARGLRAAGAALAVHDPDVRLERLIGANRRYLEDHLPGAEALLRKTCEEVLRDSEVIVVGVAGERIRKALELSLEDRHVVVDLVGLRDAARLRGRYLGLCW